MGLTASQAVRLLFHRIAVDQAFPLELKVPNAETRVSRVPVDLITDDRMDEVLAIIDRLQSASYT